MHINIEKTLEFRDTEGNVCGVYYYDDPFKSYFGALYTPGGKNVVARPPKDHPHHKGLQFGLCTSHANFWEESTAQEPNNPPPPIPIGKQRTTKMDVLPADAGVGFVQEVQWEVDTRCLFNETRRVTVEKVTGGYRWTWRSSLVVVPDSVTILTSAWPGPGYCGLGLRLSRALFERGTVHPPGCRSGSDPARVAYQGQGAQVIFEQGAGQGNVLFVSSYLADPGFAFMSLGPTNRAPRVLPRGAALEGSYVVVVADL